MTYRQCDGDVNPATYGGTFYRTTTPDEVELLCLQPVLEHVSDGEALDIEGAYWVKTTVVDRSDLARLIADEGWRKFIGVDSEELPDPATVDLLNLARWAASDNGYGLLDWEPEGNPTGEQVHTRFALTDFNGESLKDDLLEGDENLAEIKGEHQ